MALQRRTLAAHLGVLATLVTAWLGCTANPASPASGETTTSDAPNAPATGLTADDQPAPSAARPSPPVPTASASGPTRGDAATAEPEATSPPSPNAPSGLAPLDPNSPEVPAAPEIATDPPQDNPDPAPPTRPNSDGGTTAFDAAPGEATDAGDPSEGAAPIEEDAEAPPGYVKGIVGVGYGGLRVVSRDGGRTWGDRTSAAPNGGDDEDLLRAVTYGKGRWIATGWKLMVSDDGISWMDLGMLGDGIIADQQVVEGLAYTAGSFYAAGDGNPAQLYRSNEGLEWERIASIGDTVQHTGLSYRGGRFVSYGDSETSFQSPDGLTWTPLADVANATYCEGEYRSLEDCRDAAWFDDGFYLSPQWGGEIRRAAGDGEFETVYRDDEQNTLYRARALAEGYVAP